MRTDRRNKVDAGRAPRTLSEGIPSAALPHEHQARIPEPPARTFEGVDKDLGGQPLGDRARVDENGT